jgi:hypothetical protein|tara:strand:+ start:594 stop:1061 length:468 start_codon:yes stop_codon:yes gene_type:complete
MNYLIKKSDGSIVEKFHNGVSKIQLPGMTGTDAVHVAGDKWPMDLGDYLLIRATINEPALGADQKCGPTDTIVDVVAQTVTVNKPAIDMTAQEIADRDHANDLSELSMSVAKMAFIQTELIDKLLAQGTIQLTDFTAPVRQIFQDVKEIVDRAKP